MAAQALNRLRRGLWTDLTCRHGADLSDVVSYWLALATWRPSAQRTKPHAQSQQDSKPSSRRDADRTHERKHTARHAPQPSAAWPDAPASSRVQPAAQAFAYSKPGQSAVVPCTASVYR